MDGCLHSWDSCRGTGWRDDLLLYNGYKPSSLDDRGLQSFDWYTGMQNVELPHNHSIFIGCEDLLSSSLETCADLLPLGTFGQSPGGEVRNLS
jgi:hypothetical protein